MPRNTGPTFRWDSKAQMHVKDLASKDLTQRRSCEQKLQDKKHAQKSHHTYLSGSETQVPDSAIVTCSSTNIETCRSQRPHKTHKTTHTCHATHLVNHARIFKLILMPEIWHHMPQRRSGLGLAQRINCIWVREELVPRRTKTNNRHARPQTRAEY